MRSALQWRYLVFVCGTPPVGGWGDFDAVYTTAAQAMDHADAVTPRPAHVVDLVSLDVIYQNAPERAAMAVAAVDR